MATKQASDTLRRKEKVRAAVDLHGVPEGTPGRVIIANGLSWIRYWVAFDNGVELGSLHRDKLVRAKDWKQYLIARQQAAERAASGADGDESTNGAEAGERSEGAGGTGATVNGVVVPQLLLDRTKAALDRFGVSR